MAPASIPSHITEALSAAHDVLQSCEAGWHLFGSCALALHGVSGVEVRDVDVLISPADAAKLSSDQNILDESGEGTDLFRSAHFLRLKHVALDVEFMADMQVWSGDLWQPFRFQTVQEVVHAGRVFYVPSLDELKQSLRLFGRAKDLARLKLIEDQS